MVESPSKLLDAVKAREAGFGLVDLIVAISIVSAFILVASSTFGMNTPKVHSAAIALEASLAEARSIAAMQQADGMDLALPTGATVSVDVDPRDTRHSTITVFRSRPIENPDQSVNGIAPRTFELPIDAGFPKQSVPVLFTIKQFGKAPQTGKFTILLSSAGYSSVISGYAYGSDHSILTTDPSCSYQGTSIVASSGTQAESHPFHCDTSIYDTSAPG